MEGAVLRLIESVPGSPAIETPSAVPPAAKPMPAHRGMNKAWRWLALHRRELRALAIGAMSLALFLLCWHLLTKYRVTVYIRFINVPSPEMVFKSDAGGA